MTAKEKFLPQRQRYQLVTLPHDFSDEEMARDWTLSETDKKEVNRYHTHSRLFIAIQLCAVRLYGRFLVEVNDLSPRIVSYLNSQLDLPLSLTINTPDRDATFSEQRKNILTYLGFTKYEDTAQASLEKWLSKQAEQGFLPDELLLRAEQYLLNTKVILPRPSVLERLSNKDVMHSHSTRFGRGLHLSQTKAPSYLASPASHGEASAAALFPA